MAADHRTSSVQLEVRGDGSRAAALWRSYGHLDSDPDFQARVVALETQFALVRANERERLLGHGQDPELRRLRAFVANIREECVDLEQMLAAGPNYHGAGKQSTQWHKGWEAAAAPIARELRLQLALVEDEQDMANPSPGEKP